MDTTLGRVGIFIISTHVIGTCTSSHIIHNCGVTGKIYQGYYVFIQGVFKLKNSKGSVEQAWLGNIFHPIFPKTAYCVSANTRAAAIPGFLQSKHGLIYYFFHVGFIYATMH